MHGANGKRCYELGVGMANYCSFHAGTMKLRLYAPSKLGFAYDLIEAQFSEILFRYPLKGRLILQFVRSVRSSRRGLLASGCDNVLISVKRIGCCY